MISNKIVVSDDGAWVEVRDRVLAAYIESRMEFYASRMQISGVGREWRCRFRNSKYLWEIAEEFQNSPQKQLFRKFYRAYKKIDYASGVCGILNAFQNRNNKKPQP